MIVWAIKADKTWFMTKTRHSSELVNAKLFKYEEQAKLEIRLLNEQKHEKGIRLEYEPVKVEIKEAE